jgi:hypothetical protein
VATDGTSHAEVISLQSGLTLRRSVAEAFVPLTTMLLSSDPAFEIVMEMLSRHIPLLDPGDLTGVIHLGRTQDPPPAAALAAAARAAFSRTA